MDFGGDILGDMWKFFRYGEWSWGVTGKNHLLDSQPFGGAQNCSDIQDGANIMQDKMNFTSHASIILDRKLLCLML